MLDSIKVQGFKLFSELEVPSLSRLNLFVGHNNSGKSCLLEAIRLLATDASLGVIRELVTSRDGDWELNISRREELGENMPGDVENPIRFLFHDFHCQGDPFAVINISSGDETRRVKLSLGLFRRSHSEDGVVRHDRVENLDELPGEDVVEMLEVSVGSKRRSLVLVDRI